MEIIIRFDENNQADLKLAFETIKRLMVQGEDPYHEIRDRLWRCLNASVQTVRGFDEGRQPLATQLWSGGIHLIGQLVTMTEDDLKRVMKTGYRIKMTQRWINARLREIDQRLHFGMTAEEMLGWVSPPKP